MRLLWFRGLVHSPKNGLSTKPGMRNRPQQRILGTELSNLLQNYLESVAIRYHGTNLSKGVHGLPNGTICGLSVDYLWIPALDEHSLWIKRPIFDEIIQLISPISSITIPIIGVIKSASQISFPIRVCIRTSSRHEIWENINAMFF